MADRKAISLRDTEQRIKRALEFRGALDLVLETGVVPVVLVADVTQPGYRAQVERSFMFGTEFTPGAGSTAHLAIKAPRVIIIDRIWMQGAGAGCGFLVGMLGPAAADPWAIATNNVRWVDRMQGSDELTGILTGTQGTDAANYGQAIWQSEQQGSSLIAEVACQIALEKDAKLILQATASLGTNLVCAFSFSGRML